MSRDRLFLDTAFVQALLNPNDQFYPQAKSLEPRLRSAWQLYTTEAVLIEVANAFSKFNRGLALTFIDQFYRTIPQFKVVHLEATLFQRGLQLYRSRPDKGWGLTDCISFVVMEDNGLTQALTSDRHFVQAGFQALMLEV